MIQYYHRTIGTPPPWLAGATSLSTREVRDGFSFCVGDGLGFFLQNPPENAVELEGGWKCWMNDDGCEPEYIYRVSPWFRTDLVSDVNDRTWAVPIVTEHSGKRAFKVAYGPDWKPALTPTQEDLLVTAAEATLFLDEVEKAGCIEDPARGCAFAAKFLEQANYITSEVIGKLRLMDDILMMSTNMRSTSRRVEDHG